MLIGAHTVIFSKNAEADRAFFRDVLHLTNVNVGEGWLIFGLPPAELAIHPADHNDVHEFYLMCDDVERLITDPRQRGVACSPVENQRWGLLTHITLPGGGRVGVYQPRHARPNFTSTKDPPQRKKAPRARRRRRRPEP